MYGVYLRGACPHLFHVVTDGLGCRHGTGQLPGLDDCCTSLLHCLQKKTGAIRAGMCYCVLMLIWKKGENIFTMKAFWKTKVCAQILHASQSLNSNSRTLFITHSNEISFKPGIILYSIKAGELTSRHIDHTVMNIWVLGGRVVTPDDHILHLACRNTTPHCYLKKAYSDKTDNGAAKT